MSVLATANYSIISDSPPPSSTKISKTNNKSSSSFFTSLLAQLTFVVSGLVLILLNQYLADCGLNSPYAGLTGAAKGFGFLFCSLVWFLFSVDCNKSMFKTCRQQLCRHKRCRKIFFIGFPIAGFDILDTIFTTGGVVWAKSGLFVIAFSSITVFVALMRKYYLKKKQVWLKWLSVVLITGSIAAAGGASVNSQGFDFFVIIGVVATLLAALCDAGMYIMVEVALKPAKHDTMDEDITWLPPGLPGMDDDYDGDDDNDDDDDDEDEIHRYTSYNTEEEEEALLPQIFSPDASTTITPFEMLFFVGACSTILSIIWLIILCVGGWWDTVVKPVEDCGFVSKNNSINPSLSSSPLSSTSSSLMWYYLSLWILQGVVGYGMHYISFFYLIMYEDCLAASVSKASQSALIFFLSSVFFCEHSPSQCLSEIKIIAAIVVFFSVIMVRFFFVIVVIVIVNR